MMLTKEEAQGLFDATCELEMLTRLHQQLESLGLENKAQVDNRISIEKQKIKSILF